MSGTAWKMGKGEMVKLAREGKKSSASNGTGGRGKVGDGVWVVKDGGEGEL